MGFVDERLPLHFFLASWRIFFCILPRNVFLLRCSIVQAMFALPGGTSAGSPWAPHGSPLTPPWLPLPPPTSPPLTSIKFPYPPQLPLPPSDFPQLPLQLPNSPKLPLQRVSALIIGA